MSIKIHHGPNGAYKTSGAIQDDAIPALKAGRVVITNVRGFTRERVFSVMPELPESVDVINLDMECLEDLEKIRTWFMWAPRGAFLIFDETQILFPKSWRESDLKRFDYPGGPEKAKADDRPIGWLDGWTRHRHWNWDVVLTTPNIGYIRDDIRMTCEKAYLHGNLAAIGIKGRYKESQHSAQDNKPPARGSIVEYRKIKPETFKFYDSTATGKVQDTTAGKSLFKSPTLVGLVVLAAVFLWNGLSGSTVGLITGSTGVVTGEATGAADADRPAVAVSAGGSAPGADAVGDAGVRVSGAPGAVAELDHPFAGRKFLIRGALRFQSGKLAYLFAIADEEGRELQIDAQQLARAGYVLEPHGECVVDLTWGSWKGRALCPGAATGGAASARSGASSAASSVEPSSPVGNGGTRVTIIPDSSRSPRTL
ncbi:zonular occludens toxin domain-containing protein [Pseudomonas aeruginosa]